MNINVTIPALDRLVDFLEKAIGEKLPGFTPGAPAAAEPKPKGKGKAAPAETPAPEAEPEKAPEGPTLKEVEEAARGYIAKTSPAAIRKLLDDNGFKGKKLGEVDAKEYPKLLEVISKATAEADVI